MKKEIKKLENKWIAIEKKSEKVIYYADTLKELFKMLDDKEKFIIFKVPKYDVNYVT